MSQCKYFKVKESKDAYVEYTSKCCGACQRFNGTRCSIESDVLKIKKGDFYGME